MAKSWKELRHFSWIYIKMEKTIEEIMTGKANIDVVLQENKEKIQEITKELEEIVRDGYFDILNCTEKLVKLANSSEIALGISLPEKILMETQADAKVERNIEDFIWELVNSGEFVKAGKEINGNLCRKSVQRIKKHLEDPYFYSVFDLEELAEQRLLGFLEFFPGNQMVLKFFSKQLLDKLLESKEMDGVLQCASQILGSLMCETGAFRIPIEEIKSGVKAELEPHYNLLKESLHNQISIVQHAKDLISFAKNSENPYGLPCIWDLCKDSWLEKAENLISLECAVQLHETLSETLENYKKKTAGVVFLLNSLPNSFDFFKKKLEKSLPDAILLKSPSNPLHLLGFLRYFSEIPLFPMLNLDFSSAELKIEQEINALFQGKSVLSICQSVRLLCADRKISLPSLEIEISQCRRGFASAISRSPCTKIQALCSIPSKKPSIPPLPLPSRFLPHLIHN